jgi:hypothetical protein
LNFAAVDEAEIERGIAVLGRLAQEHVRRGGLDPPVGSSGRRAAR